MKERTISGVVYKNKEQLKNKLKEIRLKIVKEFEDKLKHNKNYLIMIDKESETHKILCDCIPLYKASSGHPVPAEPGQDNFISFIVQLNRKGKASLVFDPQNTHFCIHYNDLIDGYNSQHELGQQHLCGPADISQAGIEANSIQKHQNRIKNILRNEIKNDPRYPDPSGKECDWCPALATDIHHELTSFSELLSDYDIVVKNRADIVYPKPCHILSQSGDITMLDPNAPHEVKRYVDGFVCAHFGFIKRDLMRLTLLCKSCHNNAHGFKNNPKDNQEDLLMSDSGFNDIFDIEGL